MSDAKFLDLRRKTKMRIIKAVLVVLTLSVLGALLVPRAGANVGNKKTVLTFSQPLEIPGQVLPAGTYTFTLVDSLSDRNIVRITNAEGTQVIATILAINNYRLTPTEKTVIKFEERSGDNPEALKAWFYPGDNFGQEFVYPKRRAVQLAIAAKEPIPAVAADTLPSDLKAVPLVAETPDRRELPLDQAIQTAPLVAQNTAPTSVTESDRQLPKTASSLPLIALLGMASLGFALVLKRFAM
jgi:hypothetical protein